jgi:hypothetical protein
MKKYIQNIMYFVILYIFIINLLFYITNNFLKNYYKENFVLNSKLYKIVNVYQLNPKNGYIQGYADFVKGCIMVLEYCNDNNLSFDIDYKEHPISKYLINNNSNQYNIDYDNIKRDPNTTPKYSYKKFMIFNQNVKKCKEPIYFTYCSEYPYRKMTQNEKDIIKSKFTPNSILKKNIEDTLVRLKLKEKEYDLVHIRAGDEFLLDNKKMDTIKFNKLINKINNEIDKNKIYLLLTDNNNLKIELSKIYSNFIYETNEIIHSSLSKDYNNDGLKNTLTDYFLISLSKSVICFCGYPHGSGFSEYCCKIYDIPYKYIKLPFFPEK